MYLTSNKGGTIFPEFGKCITFDLVYNNIMASVSKDSDAHAFGLPCLEPGFGYFRADKDPSGGRLHEYFW